MIQLAGTVSIHLDFCKQREVDIVFGLGKFQNFFVGTGFLSTELITGKAENSEPLVAELFLNGTQTCVLGREASLTGQVDDEQCLIAVFGE